MLTHLAFWATLNVKDRVREVLIGPRAGRRERGRVSAGKVVTSPCRIKFRKFLGACGGPDGAVLNRVNPANSDLSAGMADLVRPRNPLLKAGCASFFSAWRERLLRPRQARPGGESQWDVAAMVTFAPRGTKRENHSMSASYILRQPWEDMLRMLSGSDVP